MPLVYDFLFGPVFLFENKPILNWIEYKNVKLTIAITVDFSGVFRSSSEISYETVT